MTYNVFSGTLNPTHFTSIKECEDWGPLNLSGPFFTERHSYASAVLGVVIMYVCLSVTRVLCD